MCITKNLLGQQRMIFSIFRFFGSTLRFLWMSCSCESVWHAGTPVCVPPAVTHQCAVFCVQVNLWSQERSVCGITTVWKSSCFTPGESNTTVPGVHMSDQHITNCYKIEIVKLIGCFEQIIWTNDSVNHSLRFCSYLLAVSVSIFFSCSLIFSATLSIC